MRKGRGKGKISNDLVAASCMAVLAVYAAGYSRTRDAARRFEIQARERRAGARVQQVAVTSGRPVIEPSAPRPAPPPQAVPERKSPIVARKAPARKAAAAAAVATVTAPPAAVPVPLDAVTAAAKPSAPAAPREIAPVPLPAEDPTTPAPIAITRDPAPAAVGKWRDGSYTGLGDSAHGDIEARVVIKDGRIVEAGIANCDTRYPCSVIDPLIHQPVERQSPDVDYMSHATESSDAYYDALVAALESALEPAPADPAIPK